jgi:hypothetical protein
MCGQSVEFESADLPRLNCPRCGLTLVDQFPSDIPRSSTPADSWDAEKELGLVRRQSCYKTLRGLIGSVIGVGFFALGLSIAAIIVALLTYPAPVQVIAGCAMLIVLCGLALIILVAIKQALLLAIDMADVAIHDRADRRLAHDAQQTAGALLGK